MTTYRHKKRGTTYEILGRAKMQIGPETVLPALPVVYASLERITFVVYRSSHDDTLWVRPETEFFDGRFEEVT